MPGKLKSYMRAQRGEWVRAVTRQGCACCRHAECLEKGVGVSLCLSRVEPRIRAKSGEVLGLRQGCLSMEVWEPMGSGDARTCMLAKVLEAVGTFGGLLEEALSASLR